MQKKGRNLYTVSTYVYTTHGTLGILNILLRVRKGKVSVKWGEIKMNKKFNPTIFRKACFVA